MNKVYLADCIIEGPHYLVPLSGYRSFVRRAPSRRNECSTGEHSVPLLENPQQNPPFSLSLKVLVIESQEICKCQPRFHRVHSPLRRRNKTTQQERISRSRENVGESPLSSAFKMALLVVESKISPTSGCQWVATGLHNPCIIAAVYACIILESRARTSRRWEAGSRRMKCIGVKDGT